MKIKNIELHSHILKAVQELGYVEATDIQDRVIPEIIKGRDVFGQSKTGSGKTAAFGIPLVQMIEPRNNIQALILTPTRELCIQVCDAINSIGKFTRVKATAVYGGVSLNPQITAVKRAHIDCWPARSWKDNTSKKDRKTASGNRSQ